ncbi:MAG: hypothetical protein ACRDVF_18035 [Microbacterium sp.]|uniref:hypothetical protein n=1 Tax=Microbacterium sp. TaxID=51671 RepID=UPI003D6FF327
MALHPGDRIQLKKRIAQTLAQQDWDDIDLTLSEFGFPTTDLWDGGADDRRGYVIQMLAGSNDDVLSQLDDYLHPTAVEPATPQPESFEDPRNPWSGDGFKLFISHVHGYAAHAGALRTELGRRSVDGFVAHDSIEPTEDWQDVIRYALASCEGCVALLTAAFARARGPTKRSVGVWAAASSWCRLSSDSTHMGSLGGIRRFA